MWTNNLLRRVILGMHTAILHTDNVLLFSKTAFITFCFVIIEYAHTQQTSDTFIRSKTICTAIRISNNFSQSDISSGSQLHALKDLSLPHNLTVPVKQCRTIFTRCPGFVFPACWYFIATCMILDLFFLLIRRLHILLYLMIFLKTSSVSNYFKIS